MAELTFAKTYYTTLGDCWSQEERRAAIETPTLVYRPQEASGTKTYYTDCQGKVFQRSRSNTESVGNPFGAFSIKYVRDSNILLPPRCLTLKQAAAYVGLTPRSYREAVHQNKYPDIIPGTRRYDRNAIDSRLNAASVMTQHHDIAKPKFSAYDDWFGNES
jgi:hypothetical protein